MGVFVDRRWSVGLYVTALVSPRIEVLQGLRRGPDALARELARLVGALQRLRQVSAYAQPRTYSASCVSFGWFALWNSTMLAIPGTFSPNGTCGMTP